jgi:hypothetical protein
MHASDYGRALWTDYNAFVDGLPSDDVTMVWNTWEDGGAYHCEMPGVSNPQAIMLNSAGETLHAGAELHTLERVAAGRRNRRSYKRRTTPSIAIATESASGGPPTESLQAGLVMCATRRPGWSGPRSSARRRPR